MGVCLPVRPEHRGLFSTADELRAGLMPVRMVEGEADMRSFLVMTRRLFSISSSVGTLLSQGSPTEARLFLGP